MNLRPIFISILICYMAASCNNDGSNTETGTQKDSSTVVVIKEDSVSYTLDGKTFKGFIVYDSINKNKRPGVLVVHEWWGLNNYVLDRARQLAGMGYIAMAVDMYGDNRTGDDPKAAEALATPFYQDPTLAKARLDAALAKLKTYSQLDTANVAAIGYCFGGFVVLNAAKLGADLNGVVSFHGGLGGVPVNKDLIKADILVAHGEADDFVNKEVEPFKKSMDSAGVKYTFKNYPGATHAFTNPEATEKGKKFNLPIAYNAAADSASWRDMKAFLDKIFNKK